MFVLLVRTSWLSLHIRDAKSSSPKKDMSLMLTPNIPKPQLPSGEVVDLAMFYLNTKSLDQRVIIETSWQEATDVPAVMCFGFP